MYAILVTVDVKPEHRDAFVAASLDDARGSVRDEPGCLRFDIIRDAQEANRLYFYEVYRDEGAFQAHLQAPHFIRWRDAVKDWYARPIQDNKGFTVFPPDELWQRQGG